MVYKKVVREDKKYQVKFFQMRGDMEVVLEAHVFDTKSQATAFAKQSKKWKNEELHDA